MSTRAEKEKLKCEYKKKNQVKRKNNRNNSKMKDKELWMTEKNKSDIWIENDVIHYFIFFILFSISQVHMRVNVK